MDRKFYFKKPPFRIFTRTCIDRSIKKGLAEHFHLRAYELDLEKRA